VGVWVELLIMSITKKYNFDGLVHHIYQTHELLQSNATRAVNYALTIRNWLIGYYIVEYEQNGEDRAKYGNKLIEEMALKLKSMGLKGFAATPLRLCRTFYLTYPQIQPTVSVELQFLNSLPIRETVSPELQLIENEQNTILRTASVKSLTQNNDVNLQPLSIELLDEGRLNPDFMLSRLNFSHFIELIRIEDPLQRLFYEVEAIKNNWSVRELKRAINTSLALRTTLSTNKEAIIAKIKNLKPATNAEVIRNPVVLEFLGIEEKSEYSESDLEQAILTHLQQFLIELGTGFCFEARQKRITFNNRHYRIDLVFYHRILKCHVLIDLKVGEFDHADAGQMTVYLNYFKKNEMAEGDNPPIGIILCADKDDALVEYATTGIDNQLFVSKYLVKLPEKKMLEDFIRNEINQ
jgi:predicted nuclease of restriction endonuclease-like (RecB) superfamily